MCRQRIQIYQRDTQFLYVFKRMHVSYYFYGRACFFVVHMRFVMLQEKNIYIDKLSHDVSQHLNLRPNIAISLENVQERRFE